MQKSIDTSGKISTIVVVVFGIIIVLLLLFLLVPRDVIVKEEPVEQEISPTPIEQLVEESIPQYEWKLVTFLQEGYSVTSPEDIEITLDIAGLEFNGFSRCNNYFGSYALVDPELQTILMNPIASTKKACTDETISSFENQYLTTLQEIASFSLYETTGLTLYSGTEGKTALSFERVN